MARSKPIPRSIRERFITPPMNRGLARKRTTDNVKNIEVTINSTNFLEKDSLDGL